MFHWLCRGGNVNLYYENVFSLSYPQVCEFMFPLVLNSTAILLPAMGVMVTIVSWREGERAAARRALLATWVVGVLVVCVLALTRSGMNWPGYILVAGFWGVTAAMLVPTGNPKIQFARGPEHRIDERKVMFSRVELEPGSECYEGYYRDYPADLNKDLQWRKMAGLLSPRGGKYEPVAFAAAKASFVAVEQLSSLVTGLPASPRHEFSTQAAADFCKGWARKLGAVSCGITRLNSTHIYSRRGRGDQYGEVVNLDHPFAIAFTVEMDHAQLGRAPEGPTVMESAQQYLAAGAIAVQLAVAIRNLGWEAEAHIDAHYKVVCPLVARDAGLGEIGRMGLLMTPELGPRVRLAVVTTTMPMTVDVAKRDNTVLDFCRICRKCAQSCPAEAIPSGEPVPVEGVRRWRINQEKCFTYWCAVGTDCGRCIRVCPYAHPDNGMHRVVRRWLKHSALFRRFALIMDDALYGRDPSLQAHPRWLPLRRRVDGTSTDS